MLAEAATLRRMWLHAARAFWECGFQELWADIAPLLLEARDTGWQELQQEHPLEWLGRLSPQTQADRGRGVLRFLVPWSGRYDASLDLRIVVRFSVLALPHTLLHWRPPVLTVQCACPAVRTFAGPATVDPAAVRALTALGDLSRLEVLLSIVGKALTPSAVAHALRLTPSTVTRHLALLQEVGLVDRERYGHFIFYRAHPEALAQALAPFCTLRGADHPALVKWFGG
jgi:ArsR family transcriptional regulator